MKDYRLLFGIIITIVIIAIVIFVVVNRNDGYISGPFTVAFYNNGTIDTGIVLYQDGNQMYDGSFIAGQGGKWTFDAAYGTRITGILVDEFNQGGHRTPISEFIASPGNTYTITQNCWWPAYPCYSLSS